MWHGRLLALLRPPPCDIIIFNRSLCSSPPQEEMTSALATMRVDYDQVKIKDLDTSSNPLLIKRRKRAAAGAKSGSTVCQSQWGPADWWWARILNLGMYFFFVFCFFCYQDGRQQRQSWTFHWHLVEINSSALLRPLVFCFLNYCYWITLIFGCM